MSTAITPIPPPVGGAGLCDFFDLATFVGSFALTPPQMNPVYPFGVEGSDGSTYFPATGSNLGGNINTGTTAIPSSGQYNFPVTLTSGTFLVYYYLMANGFVDGLDNCQYMFNYVGNNIEVSTILIPYGSGGLPIINAIQNNYFNKTFGFLESGYESYSTLGIVEVTGANATLQITPNIASNDSFSEWTGEEVENQVGNFIVVQIPSDITI